MREVTRKGLISVAAAGGVLVLSGGTAFADAGAESVAANSPGVLAGNNVQVPVHVPVNLCGNTVNVIGLLNPAIGNSCANVSAPSHGKDGGKDGSHSHGGGAEAESVAANSPGVGSGNNVQVPVDVPVNACGNGISVVGLLNPTTGNGCGNGEIPEIPVDPQEPETPVTPEEPETPVVPETPEEPETPETPEEPETPVTPETPETPEGPGDPVTPESPETPVAPEAPRGESPDRGSLAETGSDLAPAAALPLAAGLLAGGAVLYRRSRANA
ncbi:chaplin [Streptomyces bohaiensis]|uniref:Chaplin n=1 Tax=Streptomyces bohaiensis TaxID=1431344 RepID=A0ABX1CHY8_9ACTN|nr:chaplin [Streptomyces bohaiensis]NJQ17533.1 chaplin [Streptomyces bohaiensis]